MGCTAQEWEVLYLQEESALLPPEGEHGAGGAFEEWREPHIRGASCPVSPEPMLGPGSLNPGRPGTAGPERVDTGMSLTRLCCETKEGVGFVLLHLLGRHHSSAGASHGLSQHSSCPAGEH